MINIENKFKKLVLSFLPGYSLKTVLKYRYFLLLVIILFSTALRIFKLGDNSLWVDEAGTASLVSTLLENGVPAYPSGAESHRSLPFLLITSFSVSFLGLTEFSLRLPSVLIGSMLVYFVYKWSEEVFNFKIGIFASILISISSWHIAMSQNARMYIMFQFLYFCSFYLVYKYLKSSKYIHLFLTGILIVLSSLTHVTGYIMFLTIPLLLLSHSEYVEKINIIGVLPILVIAWFIVQKLYFDARYIIKTLEFHPFTAFDQLSWMIINIPVFLFLGSWGLLKIRDKYKTLMATHVVGILPPLLVYFFLIELPASRYIFFTLPFLAMMTSFASFSAINRYNLNLRKSFIGFILFLVLFVSISGNPLNPELGSHSPRPDYKSAYNFIGQNWESNDVLIAGRPLPADYYLVNPDYVLLEKTLLGELSRNGTEYYSGSPIVTTPNKLNNIITSNDTGWIVTTDTVQRGISDDLLIRIEELNLAKSERDIKVWRWD